MRILGDSMRQAQQVRILTACLLVHKGLATAPNRQDKSGFLSFAFLPSVRNQIQQNLFNAYHSI
jgi:hypothetical protein